MTCCRPCSFFLLFFIFICSLLSLPTGVMPVSSSSSSCCFCPCSICYLLRVVSSAQQVSVPLYLLQHVWCSSGNYSLSFPFRSSCITFSSTRVVFRFCFVSFSFRFSFLLFLLSCLFFFASSFSLFSSFFHGLACFVVFSYPGTPAPHLLYLDALRLFGLLCFTIICDDVICISLGLIITDSGCTDDDAVG